MFILNILQTLLNLQANLCPDIPDNMLAYTPATAFTAIGAAFATQGYWVQSDLLDVLIGTRLGLWAPLLYVLAAAGGLIGVAIGSPPRTYMWFFIGPAVYSWLIDTREEVQGVRWAIPCANVQQLTNFQKEVWKLAEVGLANTNMARRFSNGNNITVVNRDGPGEDVRVKVANLFLWFDILVSSTVHHLTKWTGVTKLSRSGNPGNSNISLDASVGTGQASNSWVLFADKKWPALEEITSAGLESEDLRDAFASFFVWCGDKMREVTREEAMVAAASTKGRKLPDSVLRCGTGACSTPRADYSYPRNQLVNLVPFPDSMKNVMSARSDTGFAYAVAGGAPSGVDMVGLWAARDAVTCSDFLTVLMLAFRFEAEHRYLKLKQTLLPEGVDELEGEDMLVSSLLYGWDIRSGRQPGGAGGTPLDIYQQRGFVRDLILLHLIRNELMMVPQIVKVRESNVEKLTGYVEMSQKTTMSKNKFSELYTWSLMIPYLQGVLLYFLAMAYPFACIFVVMPGWHKTVFTWMSFWAWVKMWDLGFAIVKSVERSVWAMTGLSTNMATISDRIAALPTQVGSATGHQCLTGSFLCPIQRFNLTGAGSGGLSLVDTSFSGFGQIPNSVSEQAWRLFDVGLTMSKSLELDLANAYYIFIMAALYMAVPAVTGQLVLGARAGAAGMVNSMVGGVASDAGRAAGSGFQSDTAMRLRSNAATIGQASYAKAMADQGYAATALGYGVKGLEESRAASEAGAMSQGFGRILGQNRNAMAMRDAAIKFDQAALNFGDHITRNGDASGGGGGGGGGGGRDPFGAGTQLAVAQSGFDASQDYYKADRAMSAQQAGFDIRAFQGNANAQQLGQAKENMGRYADFSAQQKAWQTKNAFANQVAGWSAAMGIQSGNVDPGQKPTDMTGMAMSGMLGGAAKGHAWQLDWNNGGHRLGTDRAVSGLTSRVGPEAVHAGYHPWSRMEAAAAVIPTNPTQAFRAGDKPEVNNINWQGKLSSRGPSDNPTSGGL